jgi:dihydrofolate reductase
MNIIVAMCKTTRGIGHKNNLPFYLPNDLKRFKKLTVGNQNNCILMGKNTWDSLPNKPLPDRDNIVVTNSTIHNIKTYRYLPTALVHQYDNVWVIGGSDIYKQYLNTSLVNKIYVTEILDVENLEYDTFFPEISNRFDLDYESPIIEESSVFGPTLKHYKYQYKIYSKTNQYDITELGLSNGYIKINGGDGDTGVNNCHMGFDDNYRRMRVALL